MVKQIFLLIKKRNTRFLFLFFFKPFINIWTLTMLGSMLSVSNALRAPYSASLRVSAQARTRDEGAGPARSRRSQGWETCPGYLPNSTWLPWRASSRDLYSGHTEGNMGRLWSDTTEVDIFSFSLKTPFSPRNIHLAKLSLRAPRLP